MNHYWICGFQWRANIPFLFLQSATPESSSPDVEFRLRDPESLDRRFLELPPACQIRNGAGFPSIQVHQTEVGFLLNCNNGRREADFLVSRDGRHIECFPQRETEQSDIEVWLFGLVLSFWLQLRGLYSLHASAVEWEGRAVAFLGWNGSGKSTLAFSFLQRGHGLLSDDLLVLEEHPEQRTFSTCPATPCMHLWSNTLEGVDGFGNDAEGEARPQKLRLTVQQLGVSFARTSLPLAVVYILGRTVASRRSRIHPLSGTPALFHVLRHIRASSAIKPSDQGPLLQMFTRLIEAVPVRLLEFPTGFEFLPEVYERVREDLSGSERPSQFLPNRSKLLDVDPR